MKKSARVIAVALIATGLAACASASEWFIDNQATGSHNGTSWTDAYTNFAVAVSNVWGAGANTGAIIYVRQATGAPDYAGGLEIAEGFADGTPDAYNRIVGWTDEGYAARPVIRLYVAGTLAAPQNHIRLGTIGSVSRTCYEIRGLRFYGTSDYYCSAVRLCRNSSNIRFVDNTCSRADFTSDDGTNDSKTNILVQANSFEFAAQISLRYNSHVEILNNTITPSYAGGSCIAGNIDNGNVKIIGNVFNGQDCISWQNGSNMVIEDNQFKARYRAAIFVDNNPAKDWVIQNNIFHDVIGTHPSHLDGNGIYFAGGSSAKPDLVIANNTFYNFPEAGSKAIYLNQYIDKASVFNNLIVGVSTGLVFEAGCASTNDYNAFWQVEVPYVGDGTAGAHDKTADPLFKNAAGFDFHLGNDTLKFSAAKAFNGIAAPTNDFFGTPRGKVLSFGAIASPPGGTQLILR